MARFIFGAGECSVNAFTKGVETVPVPAFARGLSTSQAGLRRRPAHSVPERRPTPRLSSLVSLRGRAAAPELRCPVRSRLVEELDPRLRGDDGAGTLVIAAPRASSRECGNPSRVLPKSWNPAFAGMTAPWTLVIAASHTPHSRERGNPSRLGEELDPRFRGDDGTVHARRCRASYFVIPANAGIHPWGAWRPGLFAGTASCCAVYLVVQLLRRLLLLESGA
jgi:hypothetical protein